MGHVRNPGVAEGADVDRVELVPKLLVRSLGQGNARSQVALGTDVELFDRELRPGDAGDGVEDLESFLGHVDADPVSRNHGDSFFHHAANLTHSLVRPYRSDRRW